MTAAGEILGAEDVVVDFGRGPVLKGLHLSIPGPGLYGILGPNGAGKTTLLNLLEGLARPTRGRLRLFGEPLSIERYPRHRVGVVLQKECSFQAIRVGEYAELFAALYGVPGGRARILEKSGLSGQARQELSTLSGGEAAKLVLYASTVHDPELVLLDEPTASLDPESKRQVGQALKAMACQRTVVMTTHDLGEAEALFERVAFLVSGEIKAAGELAQVRADDSSASSNLKSGAQGGEAQFWLSRFEGAYRVVRNREATTPELMDRRPEPRFLGWTEH